MHLDQISRKQMVCWSRMWCINSRLFVILYSLLHHELAILLLFHIRNHIVLDQKVVLSKSFLYVLMFLVDSCLLWACGYGARWNDPYGCPLGYRGESLCTVGSLRSPRKCRCYEQYTSSFSAKSPFRDWNIRFRVKQAPSLSQSMLFGEVTKPTPSSKAEAIRRRQYHLIQQECADLNATAQQKASKQRCNPMPVLSALTVTTQST